MPRCQEKPNQNLPGNRVVRNWYSCYALKSPSTKQSMSGIPEQSSLNTQSSIVFPSTKSFAHPPPQFFCESPIRKLRAMCKPHCPSRKSILLPPYKTSFSNGAAAIGQTWNRGGTRRKLYLDESNVRGLLSEALTADVQAILADQTSFVGTNTAISQQSAPAPISSYPSISRSIYISISRNCQGVRTRRELPCRRFLGASSRRIRETCWVDFVLFLDLKIRIRLGENVEMGY
jgi:hypothetical protein